MLIYWLNQILAFAYFTFNFPESMQAYAKEGVGLNIELAVRIGNVLTRIRLVA